MPSGHPYQGRAGINLYDNAPISVGDTHSGQHGTIVKLPGPQSRARQCNFLRTLSQGCRSLDSLDLHLNGRHALKTFQHAAIPRTLILAPFPGGVLRKLQPWGLLDKEVASGCATSCASSIPKVSISTRENQSSAFILINSQ